MGSHEAVARGLSSIVEEFVADRPARQRRRELDRADFDALAATGLLSTVVPVELGGLFESVPSSTRPIAEHLRLLAHGDSSVALVSSMHYQVLSFWLVSPESVDPSRQTEWASQREWAFASAMDGHWWGTCTSEPGSGGDAMNTKTVAEPTDRADTFRLSGDKHFGSGTGICSYMVTTALPAGRKPPGFFVLDMTERPWESGDGVEIIAPWDGHGMTATQSHGLRLTNREARHGFGINLATSAPASAAGVCCFIAVVLGIVETAVAEAMAKLGPKKAELRAYERVELTGALNEAWLLEQAYEGALRATEAGANVPLAAYQAKTAGAALAESCLAKLSRAVGGSAFNRSSPLGFWAEDVRALGFLRPPWSLAHDTIFDLATGSR